MIEQPDKDSQLETNVDNQQLRNIISWVVVIILTLFGGFCLYNLTNIEDKFWKALISKQFPVLVALPLAGLGALFISLILRISAGPIEFELAGLKFKGGAAPIVFWIICFLSIVLSIQLLWQN